MLRLKACEPHAVVIVELFIFRLTEAPIVPKQRIDISLMVLMFSAGTVTTILATNRTRCFSSPEIRQAPCHSNCDNGLARSRLSHFKLGLPKELPIQCLRSIECKLRDYMTRLIWPQ